MEIWPFDEKKNVLRWLDCHFSPSPLVYIHGLGCASSNDYLPVITSTNYSGIRSWLVDLPGSGFSDKPMAGLYDSSRLSTILQTWITSIGVSTVNLFGHSAGTFIALKMATAMSPQPERLILCAPGLNDYGITLLENITTMSEYEFIATGFNQLMMQLKNEGGNDAWLGPFQVSSPRAVYQWAMSTLNDNEENWLEILSRLPIAKGVILPDNASQDNIAQYIRAGCLVALVPNSGHMMAYDNPDGLAAAISWLMYNL
ncbi:alpha/beta hydrolase [Dickeya dianthicola]|uniref:alpha/beta fold hydrolase n=1 Tax=Dickeya dianthicola TaxID=204039 RepID=UPI0030181988